jgi:MPBQ/MSBQ methyltransferase
MIPRKLVITTATDTYTRDMSKPRMIQHKNEAFWFYRFLSIVYDHVVNPGHWTEDMREAALEPAMLNDPNLKVGGACNCYSI